MDERRVIAVEGIYVAIHGCLTFCICQPVVVYPREHNNPSETSVTTTCVDAIHVR